MNNVKRLLLCLLALTMLLGTVACGDPQTPPAAETTGGGASDTGEAGTGDVSVAGGFPVVRDGQAVAVVYPMNDMNAMSLAQNIARKIKNLTGVEAECRDDSRLLGEGVDMESYEILVGAVDYPCYQEALKTIAYGDAAVLVMGHKLMVLSMVADNLSSASLKLMAALTTGYDASAKTLLLAEDLRITVEGNSLSAAIPPFAGKTPSGVYQSTATATLAYFENVTEAEMDAYQKTVLDTGFSLYAGDMTTGKTADAKNRFLTFQSERYVLTLCYTPATQELRAIIEKQENTSLGWNATDGQTAVNKVCDVTMTQIGLCYDAGYFNGMSYVMRLEDGSFIVVDGGHDLQKNADRLYYVLRKQAVDPDNIVIAAWIFSHSHTDHCGFFPSFSASYASKVTVERFIYNLPVSAQFDKDSTESTNSFITGYVKRYAGAKVTVAHPGQVYYLHGATIRILYTADMMLPTMIDYGNTASMGWTIEVAGVRTAMLGDLGYAVASRMLQFYNADVLRSDVLQVAHHGIGSSPNILYPYIDPAYAMIPIGTGPLSAWAGVTEDCISFVNSNDNKYFFQSEKCKDHVYVANDDIYVLTYREGQVVNVEQYENDVAYLSGTNAS